MTDGKSKDLQVLLKADRATIALTGDKDGRIRVNASSMRDPAVILPGEQVVVRCEYGQVVVARQAGTEPARLDLAADSLGDAGY